MIHKPSPKAYDKLKIAPIRKGTYYYRITLPTYPSPLYFNKDQSGRYNSPKGEYGVCYVAETVKAAFCESIGHSVAENFKPSHKKIIDEASLDNHHIYRIELTNTMHVAELCGDGLQLLNIDNQINTSPKPYTIPQLWSAWTYNHKNMPDGVRYHSRHSPFYRCISIFERFEQHLRYVDMEAVSSWVDPKNGENIWDMLDKLGWVVV